MSNLTKKRVLYVSSVLPDTTCGAHIAIYRHFVIKNDFEIAVCSYVAEGAMVSNKLQIHRHPLLKRFFNSRFARLFYNLEYIINWYRVPAIALRFAREFKPDIIFTVPDNMHSGIAYNLAKRLRVPLAVDFQDLFPLSRFIPRFMEPFEFVRRFLTRKFFLLNERSPLTFYTSEGMQLYFGGSANGHVLYPVGDFEIAKASNHRAQKKPGTPLKITYAGNCYGAYGRMLLAFSKIVKNDPAIRLKIFPVGKGWSDDEIAEMKAAGIYQSFLPFEALKAELQDADAFLTVMSFEDDQKPFVSTSFTTKWLDYAPYGKPIFVWGPEYSSASIFALKHGCGVIVNENDPQLLKNKILQTVQDEEAWIRFSDKAKLASTTILNPETIHGILVENVKKVVT